MLADWHPQQGIMALTNKLEEGILFVDIIKNWLTNSQVVDIGISVIRKIGLFTHSNTKLLELPDDQKNFANFKQFWWKQCNLLKKTMQTAERHGYGGNAMNMNTMNPLNKHQTTLLPPTT